MRIESVALLDFGPFHRRHIRLARGLNVVHGPNEAGKSTWLAGTYLALCGTRRGRGLARMERALEERHRPWDGRPWQAAAVVELADGRRVELRQELGARGGGQATDLALGRDVTGEITAEGAPDAARWLGLDRAAFLATACVRQAEVAAVTAQPELLREHLQRAAASGGAAASATAATALEQLDEYHRRHIGGERAAMRPLRRSRDAVAAARTALGAARAEHERYVALAADVRRIESELERAEAELAAVTAARARAVADGAARRLAAARGGQPSSGEGGDDEVAPEIRAAAEAWDRTRHTLAAHRQAAPPDPVPPRSPLDGASLHHLAHELETGGEPADAPAGARHGDVERRARGGILPWAVAALGAVLLLAGLAVAFAGHPAPGLGAAVVGAALAGVVLLRSGRREIALTELRERVGAERRRAAAARAADVGLAPDPAELRALAAALAEAGEARARRREWELIDAEHEARATAATDRLWSALAARGVPRGGDVAPALAAYREACRRRHARLQARFGGATPEELRAIAEDAAARADELARGVDAARLAAARDAGDDDVERAAARVRDARRPLDEARGHLRALEDGVGSVSDAEEALAAAETARARVERLDRVLTLTRTALERAQEDVHRSVAPRLAATLRAWLPRVTGGRWTDAAVDPAELDVRVCGPTREWRPAELLSQGTREQIYLLLRIALVEHLTRPGESSPLLFDEVTVHSDGARSAAVLDLLHELSRTHQVVLFTQEDRVLAWAERHRDPGRDRLVSLDAAASTGHAGWARRGLRSQEAGEMAGRSYVNGPSTVPLLGETIGENLRRTVERWGDREALVVRQQGYRATYRELWDSVSRCARGLLARGVAAGDRVGIWAPNRYEWVVLQYATARIGAVLVNINPAYKTAELEYALNQSGTSVLVLARAFRTADYVAMLAEVRPRTPGLREAIVLEDAWEDLLSDGDGVDEARLAEQESGLQFDDPINIQYTSGTTGFPKGATLSHHNILNNGFFVTETLRLTERDRLCVPVPFYHCFGMVMANLGCTSHGACIVVPGEGFDALATMTTVQEERCTTLYGVPTMFIAQLGHPEFGRFDFSSLRTGVMAGSPCPIEVMRQVQARMHMPEVTICYGMTETSPVSTQSATDDPLEKRVATVGRAHPHVEIKVVDPRTGAVVPRGVPGELCTRGYSVMLGYWEDEGATRDAIDAARWMHTGDLATMDDEGYLSIVGRIKDMIIRGGENVYPREVEEFLYTHPAVADVQVIGVPSERYGEEVMAWVKLKDGAGATDDELLAFCKGRIATFKIPSRWKFVDGFPMTVTGKIQKYLMRQTSIEELGLTGVASTRTA